METRDSLDALFSMAGGTASYVVKEEEFMEGFHEVGEEEEEEEEGGGHVAVEKKRRLSVPQVRSLEKNFEVENKLEPQRKMQLAKELGLQPRQVAVWFQNRRARWKTKQLEKEYGLLKLNFDSLKASFDDMQRDNHKLADELASLQRKWEETGKRKAELPVENSNIVAVADSKHLSGAEQQGGLVDSNGVIVSNETFEGSETDSSAILSDHAAVATGNNSPRPIDSYISSSLRHTTIYLQQSHDNNNDIKSCGEGLMEAFCCTQSSNNNHIPSKLPGTTTTTTAAAAAAISNQQQYSFKIDDNEESCNFFNVDDPAAATLPWWEWA